MYSTRKRPFRKSPRKKARSKISSKEGPFENHLESRPVRKSAALSCRSLKKKGQHYRTRLTLVPIPYVDRTDDLVGTALKTHCLRCAKQGFLKKNCVAFFLDLPRGGLVWWFPPKSALRNCSRQFHASLSNFAVGKRWVWDSRRLLSESAHLVHIWSSL